MSGNTSPVSLITCHWPPLLRETFSVFMEDFPQVLILSIRLSSSIESWRCLMRVQFVISYGPTQMIDAVGVSLQEVRDTLLVKISQSNSITLMTWSSSQEHISLWWTAITGLTTGTLSQCSQPLTTATDAVTRPPLWRLMSSWSTLSCSSTQHQIKIILVIWIEELQIISCEELVNPLYYILMSVYNYKNALLLLLKQLLFKFCLIIIFK